MPLSVLVVFHTWVTIVTVRSLISVHRPRYFRFFNVLHIWTIRAIPTYRVYRLYDNIHISYTVIILIIGLVYYLLGNLHPKFRSSLKSIQLLCVARNPIIVQYGIEDILKPVVESIQELEKIKIHSACKRTITLE